jgi:hypothetical protein
MPLSFLKNDLKQKQSKSKIVDNIDGGYVI